MDLGSGEIARFIYLSLILLSISGWLIVSLKSDFSKTIQKALIWFLIFFGLVGVYGVWTDYSTKSIFGDPLVSKNGTSFSIKKAADGHYYSSVKLNDKRIRVLIDTGATKTLLSIEDAEKLDIPISDLEFRNPIQTANGLSYTASYPIKTFEWLGKNYNNLEVQIADGNLFHSLLGMDVINSAKAIVISEDLLSINF